MMKHKRICLIVSSLLMIMGGLVGCVTDSAEKTNRERITNHRAKINELRSEDQKILTEIDTLLDKSQGLIDRADRLDNSDEEQASLVLDAAEAVLVEANTRRFYAAQRASYDLAREAYLKRATRIRKLRDQLESDLPTYSEGNQ